MGDYIIDFEHLYKRMRVFGMKLPDPVLAFKLLDGSNISDDERQLALPLGKDMKHEDMISVLIKLFNKFSPTTTAQYAIIKQEEAFYSKGEYKSSKYPSLNNKTKTIKHNPLNKHGQISRCVVCNSKCTGRINVTQKRKRICLFSRR